MNRHPNHAFSRTPGRCHCCGHLMIMLRLRDSLFDDSSVPSIGWRCLFCESSVGLQGSR